VLAPKTVARSYGVPITPAGLQLQRLFGSRALAISVLALTARTDEETDRGLLADHGNGGRELARLRGRRAGGAGDEEVARYQRSQCTTSSKGRRSGLTSGRSGRSAG
jgi:hypothetical protein